MPYRRTPIVTDEIYHVCNRSIGKQQIFATNKDYQRFLDTLSFYIFDKPTLRFSHYNRLPLQDRDIFLTNLRTNNKKRAKVLAYCLMPNHLHFLFRQLIDNGVSDFMSNLQESYAKYLNAKNNRSGALFQSMFKAVRIETDEQLIHVARYIHLNPITSYVIKSIEELENYPWCSFAEYIGKKNYDILDKDEILGYFSSLSQFKEFTYNQIDYQRELGRIKHLALE